MPDAVDAAPSQCPDCSAPLTAALLSCPACQRLVHSEALKKIAQEADVAAAAGDLSAALTLWRQALDLLPPQSKQYQGIHQKIVSLSTQLDEQRQQPGASSTAKKSWLGSFGIIGTILLFVFTKGKFLLLGLSKAGTFFSMLAAFGVYWLAFGWKFAAGIVVCTYIHEMGHVAALRHYGIPATAPMFIPGLGAFVRIKQYPATPNEDAYVGLAGPLWGLGAACLCYVIFLSTGNIFFAAMTHVTAWLNLANLTPVWSLDGGRGFRALTLSQRVLAFLSIGGAWFCSGEGLLLFVLFFAFFKLLFDDAPKKPDHSALAKYIFLIATLTALSATTDALTRAALGRPATAGSGNAVSPAESEEPIEDERK